MPRSPTDQLLEDLRAHDASQPVDALAERYRTLILELEPRACLALLRRGAEEVPPMVMSAVILKATRPPADPAFSAKVQTLREWSETHPETPLGYEKLRSIVDAIEILDRRFLLSPVSMTRDDGWFLQVTYDEIDVDTGYFAEQRSRKWLIEPGATETDVVRTAFAAVSRSYAHVIAEHFTYKGKRVFGPHVGIDALLGIAP